jgi:hypothetical protein
VPLEPAEVANKYFAIRAGQAVGPGLLALDQVVSDAVEQD